MRTRLLLVLTVSCSLALTGCITINAPQPAASPSSGPSDAPAASESPTTAPVPAAAPQLTATLDGIVYSHDNTTKLYPFSNCQQIVDLFKTVSGVMPTGEELTAYYDPSTVYATRYDWGVALVDAWVDGDYCDIRIRGAAMNAVPMTTEVGISVGATQAEVIAAGAWNARPGFTDEYGLSTREVPGTSSLMKPGSVGIEFIGLFMDSGKVSQIILLDNDYGDL